MRPIFCGNFEYDARQTELERLFKRYGRVERVDMKSGKLMFFPHWLLSLAAREVVEVDMVLMKLTLVTAVFFVVREDVNRTITELLNMYGRDCLGKSILSPANGWLFRILFLSCDKHLLVFKKSHSHPQWQNHANFPQTPLPFISHDFCPALNSRHVSTLKHCQPHSRGSRIDGEGTLFSLTHHETSTFGFYVFLLYLDTGFAFIYMEDERDAEDAIRGLDRVEFGRKGRRLRVEWTKQERGIRRPGGTSRRSTNTRPSKTLFVINFDPHHTRTKDLERHFEPYGRIVSVRIRRNFAFVQYEVQEDATKALDATNLSKLLDRVISVEYAVRDDDERKDGYSPDRSRDRSPDRRGHDRRRSPSPYRRERGSPDYGRGPSPYRKERGSPDYGRRRSPSPYRRDRASPDYGRGTSRSPYRRERAGSDHGHGPSRSPYHRDKVSPVNGHGPSDSPYQREERISPENGRGPSRSPYRRERSNQGHGRGSSRSPYGRERPNPDNGRGSSRSPNERDGDSPENGQLRSPSSIPDERDSPNGGAESPMRERYRSQSPPADE
ncbi:hypothetical protein POTOM_049856 [Populus tomentosa]|uniref:RRM domain-containing protein n=1 Tax=Populus tomentosa TaxID=118781 RepID=A0A8X7YEN0_POPTO|nr:hypothetical protein POTOM_049856 [Populus tomentosa]